MWYKEDNVLKQHISEFNKRKTLQLNLFETIQSQRK